MIEERVLRVIKENLISEIDRDLRSDDSLDELNINSITFIKIIVGLEDEFNITIDDDKLLYTEGQTLSHFIKMVEGMLG